MLKITMKMSSTMAHPPKNNRICAQIYPLEKYLSLRKRVIKLTIIFAPTDKLTNIWTWGINSVKITIGKLKIPKRKQSVIKSKMLNSVLLYLEAKKNKINKFASTITIII